MDSGLVGRLLEYCLGRSPKVFGHLHTNPAVGWMVAEMLANAGRRFPVPLIGRDSVIFRAYSRLLNPAVHSDPMIDDAHRLAYGAKSGVLKAFLIAGLGKKADEHLELVAAKSGVSMELASAFEILFFNVLDRNEDGLYLSTIAYPCGRPVTFGENYFKKATVDDLLLRAAYDTRDVEFVEYLSGLDPKHFVKALKADKRMERKLEEKIFSNAQVQMNAGLVNQKSAGIDRAVRLAESTRKTKQAALSLEVPVDFDIGEQLRVFLAQARSWGSWPAPLAAIPQPPVVFEDPEPSAGDTNAGKPGDSIESFPVPRHGIWRNKDADKPVVIVAVMSSPGLPDHYLTEEGTGLPVSEVEFED